MGAGAVPERWREFSKLTAQFALIRGLLIGVAGYHRSAFSTAHVVATVQSAAKHFEHHPEFLKLAYELLLESQMDGARGLAILLRNATHEPGIAVLAESPRPGPYPSGPAANPWADSARPGPLLLIPCFLLFSPGGRARLARAEPGGAAARACRRRRFPA